MFKKIKSAPAILLAVAFLVGLPGCDAFLDDSGVVTDPNRAIDVPADQLFQAIQINNFFHQEGGLARTVSMWMQHMSGTDRQYTSYGQYTITDVDHDGEMDEQYVGGGLTDIRKIRTLVDADGNRLYSGVTKVWEALLFSTGTNIWGDLPYSEAVNGDFLTPKLDEMQEIDGKLMALLDEAIADFQSGEGSIPSIDYVYSGDVGKWVEAAHSLKARIAMHWAEVDANMYNLALTHARQGISSEAGDFRSRHGSGDPEANDWYQFNRDRGTYIRSGKHLVDLLSARNDPRLPIFFGFAEGTTEYIGSEPGDGNQGASNLSATWLEPTRSQDILTRAETQLIIAECLYKTNDEDGALAMLNDARAELETKWNAAGAFPALTGLSGQALIEAIVEEMYIVLFQNIEVWAVWKRTNLPALVPAGGRDIPRRIPYSANERNANPNIPTPDQQPVRNDNDPGDTY